MEILQEGLDTLPRCQICGMHMHAAKMIQNRLTDKCNRETEMHLWSRDMYISQKEGYMRLSLYDREYNPLLEEVMQFQHLGRKLDEMDSEWPYVHKNISKAQEVWQRLGKLL